MLDTFVERWLGPLLTVLGLIALALGIAELVNLPPAASQLPVRIILGGPDPMFRIEMLTFGGIWMLLNGLALVTHFRRERRSDGRSV